MTLTKELKQQIKDICLNDMVNESCGFILSRSDELIVYSVLNEHENPLHFFSIGAKHYIMAARIGEIIGVYHSHNSDKLDFSEYDKQSSEKLNLPYILYCSKNDSFSYYEPSGYINRYVGRHFQYGVSDCFNLIIDYYLDELNVKIPNFLDNRDENWPAEIKHDILAQFLDKTPLRKINRIIEKPEKNDIMILDYGKNKFHFLIYLGDDQILHQPRNEKSRIEPLNDMMKKLIYCHLRAK